MPVLLRFCVQDAGGGNERVWHLCRGVIVTGFWLGRFMRSLDDAGRQRVLADVMELLVKQVFKPRAGRLL